MALAVSERQLPETTAPYTLTYTSVVYVWLGPLTTIYTPPTSCYETTTFGSPGGYFIYDYQVDTTLTCWPSISGTTQITSLIEIPGGIGNGYYSPGICPSGWTGSSSATNFYGTRSGNAVLCCPPHYALTYPSLQGAECYFGVPQQGILTNVWLPPSGSGVTGQASFGPSDTLTSITLSADTHVACSPISVSWEATDTAILELLASLAGSTITSSTSSITTSSLPTTSSPSPPTGSSATTLSGGAKAGISVAIVIVVLGAAIGVFLFFRQRGRARPRGNGNPDAHEMETRDNTHEMLTKNNMPEMEVNAAHSGAFSRVNELDAVPNEGQESELDGSQRVAIQKLPRKEVASRMSSEGEVRNRGARATRALSEDEENRLRLLKERIEKIRVEKERLKRIQELEGMEEMTARQIAEGGRIQELEDLEETMKREILDTELRRDAGS